MGGERDRVEERVLVEGAPGLVRELVWLGTEEGSASAPEGLRVPMYLLRPAQAEPGRQRPAVVVFPGHGTIAQAAGLERSQSSCQQNNALELARTGFVTLAVEPRGFGRLGTLGHLRIDAAARLVGRTWYGMLVQDALRAIDYLLTRPEVDPARIGVTGIGAGGATAMYTAALDERVQAALINSYLGKYVVTSLDEEHCPCNDIPGILRYAEMGDVAALLAPRPVLFVNGRRDPATNPSAHESFAVVQHMYRALGVPRRARLIEPEELGQSYDNQLAIGWFRRWLGE
jgi:dienelactone hydrolase